MKKAVVIRQVTLSPYYVGENTAKRFSVARFGHVEDVVQEKSCRYAVFLDYFGQESWNASFLRVIFVESSVDYSHVVVDKECHQRWNELQDEVIFLK